MTDPRLERKLQGMLNLKAGGFGVPDLTID